jgi:hypothetical protein
LFLVGLSFSVVSILQLQILSSILTCWDWKC